MITISLRPITVRIILLLLLAAGIGVLGWYILHAAIGDSIITFIQRSSKLSLESQLDSADLAVKYSPRDPMTHWWRGGVYYNAANEELTEERIRTALDELRKAAQMSPEDYRVWLALGRVLDRYGSQVEARAALERALKLAPNHFDTHWIFGNHLLRTGDRDGSFAQMRLALANRPSALPLIFDYAWSAFQGDGKAIAKALDPPIQVKPQMVSLLITRGRVEEGLAVWHELSAPTPKDVQKVTESLVNTGRYSLAYDIWKTGNIPNRPVADEHSLLANGGFESNFSFNSTTPFYTWRIPLTGGVRVTLDRKEPREGSQSLRFSFDVGGNISLILATQTIPIKPNKQYCLSFSAKTEELESLSTPFVEIYDPVDIKRARAAAEPVRTRNNDWEENVILLKTANATEAVTVRLLRLPCSEPPCPINGRVWFDDFKLNECAGVKKPEKRETQTALRE